MAHYKVTLKRLIELTSRKDLPARAQWVQLALELLEDHMENVREGVTMDGRAYAVKDPQRQAANKCLEVAAALALKFEAKPDDADFDADEFVRQVTEGGMAGLLMSKLAAAVAGKKPEGTEMQ